jgi:hypothetical protein
VYGLGRGGSVFGLSNVNCADATPEPPQIVKKTNTTERSLLFINESVSFQANQNSVMNRWGFATAVTITLPVKRRNREDKTASIIALFGIIRSSSL